MLSKLTKEQQLEIIALYISGRSAKEISTIYPISSSCIYSLLKKNLVPRRSYSEIARKYNLDENYFSIINTSEKAYFLGFLMADGYNNEARGVIELSCAKKDKEILEKLNRLIGSNKPIRFVKSKGIISYRIDWCSRRISDDLKKHGCIGAKSLTLKFPELPDCLISHFVRGYFDGDGCISYSYSFKNNLFNNVFGGIVNFTSTDDFCLYLKKYLRDKLNVRSAITCRHPLNKNTNRTLTVSGNIQVKKVMSWMYENAQVYLLRKRDKYIKFKKILKLRKKRLSEFRKNN